MMGWEGVIIAPPTVLHSQSYSRTMRTLTVLSLLFWTVPALAQFDGTGAKTVPSTVRAVLDNPQDDQTVTLRGRLLEQVGNEKYAFVDDTGQIRVEIDNDVFPKQRITSEMTVEIYGEVEKDFLQSPEVDVERLTVVRSDTARQNPGQ